MIRTAAATAFACLALAASAQGPSFVVHPPNPVAGEEFVAMMIGTNGDSPSTVLGTSLERAPDGNLYLATRLGGGTFFAVPSAFRASAVGRLSLPGRYLITERRTHEGNPTPSFRQIGEVTIAPSTGTHAPQFTGLTGNWYDFGEPGWGINMLQNEAGQLFAIWLTFQPVSDISSPPRRVPNLTLVMPSGRWISATEYRGVLYATFGTPVQVPFVDPDTRVVPVGHGIFEFKSGSEAEFTARGGLELFESTLTTTPDFFVHKTLRKFQF